MRRNRLLGLVVLSASLTLATSGVAWAHVTVQPEEIPAGEYEKLTVTVPSEKDIPNTEVRVGIPEGFTVTGVKPVPGWEFELEEEAGVVTAVAWTGGQIGPDEFQEFEMQALSPEEPGDFTFPAVQTYEDGSLAEWTGPAGSEEEAPVVSVAAGGGESHEHGADEDTGVAAAPAEDLPQTGGTPFPTAASAALFAAGIAVGLGVMAILRRRSGSEG